MNGMLDTLTRAERLLEQRGLAQAISLFHRAEAEGHDPDRCAAGRWMAAMLAGDFAAAWDESAAIRRRGSPDSNRFWQGEDWYGKRVILRCLHGLGDTVQFLRYVPRVRDRAARLIVECAPRAIELVRCLPGIEDVITWGPEAPSTPPVWDVQLETLELPCIFRSTCADLPITTNYLRLPPAELEDAAHVLASCGGPHVGVVWSSGEWNPSRSLPLQLLWPLLAHRECQFWNLQGGWVRREWQSLPVWRHLRDTPMLADAGVIPMAAVISHLDLVITVDTLAAHLAGALGIPCFLLLQYAADWRWMIDRNDSPWYPSLRLFRQPAPGDWNGAVAQVNRALRAQLSGSIEWRSVA
jgi:hypothetical protein